MAKPIILIAEDDLFLQQIYRHSLEAEGYETVLADNGRETLEKIAAGSVNLLLLDLNMPEVTGMQVLEQMHADGRINALPVIVLTNFNEDEYGQKCLDLGVRAFFTKSNLSFESIIERVKMLLKISKPEISKAASITPAAPAAAPAQTSTSGSARVLVVEDDPFLSEIYKQNLKERGYDVVTAAGGREALELLGRDANWNVILLDLLMPEMDGFTVLEGLRAKGFVPGIPVIVLTNLSQESDKRKALELGAADFAIKSELSFDEIVAHAEAAMKKQKPA